MAEEPTPHEEQDDAVTPAPDETGQADADPADDLQQAEDALAAVEGAAAAVEAASAGGVDTLEMPSFGGAAAAANANAGINLLSDVALRVKIELGRTRMYVEDVLRLNTDSVIELDKAAGDPVDIFVNDRHIARGEVLVLNENFCVRVSEIIDNGATEE